MRIMAISSPAEASARLDASQRAGYITFVYHHADPEHELLRDKFLYVGSDEELKEKIYLLEQDVTARDLIHW